MERREAIKKLKEKIKELAVKQKLTKRARKQIPLEEFKALKKKVTGNDDDSARVYWYPQEDAHMRRIEITACLNFYLELREKEYRHGVKMGTEQLYNHYRSKLLEEYKIEETIAV